MAPPKKNDLMAQLARQSPTAKLGLLFLAVLLIGAGYWQFFLKDLRAKKESAEQSRNGLLAAQLNLNKRIDALAGQRVKLDNLKTEVDSIDFALPTEPELNSFIERLQKLAGNANVQFKSYTQDKESKVDQYMKVPLNVTVQGDYFALVKFFLSIAPEKGEGKDVSGDEADGNRIITIENIEMGDPEVQNDQVVLTAKFTAATFHQEAAPMPAGAAPAPSGAKPAGAPAAPVPAGGARPAPGVPAGAPPPAGARPAAPVGTPAKVEAEVEKTKAKRIEIINEGATDPNAAKPGGPGVN